MYGCVALVRPASAFIFKDLFCCAVWKQILGRVEAGRPYPQHGRDTDSSGGSRVNLCFTLRARGLARGGPSAGRLMRNTVQGTLRGETTLSLKHTAQI